MWFFFFISITFLLAFLYYAWIDNLGGSCFNDLLKVAFLSFIVTWSLYHIVPEGFFLFWIIGVLLKFLFVPVICLFLVKAEDINGDRISLYYLGSILFCLTFRIFIAATESDTDSKRGFLSNSFNPIFNSTTFKKQEIAKVKKQAAAVHQKLETELTNGKIESTDPIAAKTEFGEVVQTDVIRWRNPKHVVSYWFQSEKYTIETGGRITNIITCEKIDAACKELENEGKSPSSESVWEKIKIKAGIDWKIFGLEFETTAHDLYELLWAEKQYQELDYEVEIFIKGYADNSVNKGWVRKMDVAYLFRTLKVNRVTTLDMKEHSKNPRNYEATPTAYYFPANKTYQNEHLPNLRAAFIRQDFVEPFLKDCNPKNKNTKVYILDGYHYLEPNQPENRMVEVYFQVYSKKSE